MFLGRWLLTCGRGAKTTDAVCCSISLDGLCDSLTPLKTLINI
ncbi:MAG: hypothetical protein OJF51_003011 [Nitrospira sp.]|nr:MAG: hypothetical protein OJF51_003011 [Nitrospira sp.]